MNPVRPLPPQYHEELAKAKPVQSNPLDEVVKRVQSRNDAIIRQFQKACGSVKDYCGVITNI